MPVFDFIPLGLGETTTGISKDPLLTMREYREAKARETKAPREWPIRTTSLRPRSFST